MSLTDYALKLLEMARTHVDEGGADRWDAGYVAAIIDAAELALEEDRER